MIIFSRDFEANYPETLRAAYVINGKWYKIIDLCAGLPALRKLETESNKSMSMLTIKS